MSLIWLDLGWIWLDFGLDFGLILVWILVPYSVHSSQSSLGGPGKLPRKSYQSYKSYESYKVHNRIRDRSSSFLGANVGLDPVQNLSKSGLRPDYEDPGRLKKCRKCEGYKCYKELQTYACKPNPAKSNQNQTKSKPKSSQNRIKIESNQNRIKSLIEILGNP